MIKQLLREGFTLKSKGYYKHAIETFYKVLGLDNTSLELLLEIGHLYNLLGNNEHALNYIEQVLEKNPAHIGALKLLQKIFIDNNKLNEATQTAKNIYLISKSSDDLATIFNLLNKQNRFSEIFEYSIAEETPAILYEKSYALLCKGNLDEALDTINKAIEIQRENKYLLLKGKILLRLNKDEECENLLYLFDIKENNPEFFNYVGLVEQRKCNYKVAIKYFKKAIELSPKKDEYYYNCASTYSKMGENSLAKKFYNLAISLSPNNQNYHFALATLYYAERHYKKALEELVGDFFEARLLKAIILYDTGYVALAQKEFKDLEKINPNDEVVIEYIQKITNFLN